MLRSARIGNYNKHYAFFNQGPVWRDHPETGATHPYPVNVGVARSNSTGKRDAEAESPLTPASKAAKALGSTSLDVA